MISVIIPVYNAGCFLEHTIKSVIEQNVETEIIIIDGNSNDNTLEIIERYSNYLSKYVSEPDNGMYDALSKGLLLATGDIICYINAGDFFYPNALLAVSQIFKLDGVRWLTGYRSKCNAENIIVNIDLPYTYKNDLIQSGIYGMYLPYIQQESTFWRADLLNTVDFNYLKKLSYAGDYYLWFCFSKAASLSVVKTPLGVFKIHDGQLSENLNEYSSERSAFTKNITVSIAIKVLLNSLLWLISPRIRALFQKNFISYDLKSRQWTFKK